jgi:pimeloyl-ACP methyl ester carboxylesterase
MRRPAIRSLLLGLLSLVAAVYLAALGWLKWNEVALVYRPVTRLDPLPGDLGLTPERLHAAGEDGTSHVLWVYPSSRGRQAPWIIFLHGNGANVTTSVNVARCHQLSLLGLNVLAVEYPGFGESPGEPSEPAMVAAAQAAWRWLTGAIGVPAQHVAIYGWSLGSAVATQLASDVDEGALVLEGAFTSVADRAGEEYPWVPVSLLLRHPFASEERIAAAGSPLLLLHARDDDIVPFAHGERLIAAARGLRQLVPLAGGHVYPNLVSEEAYLRALHVFLSDALDTALTPPPRSLGQALLESLPTDPARRTAGLALAQAVLSGSRRGYNRASYAIEYAGRRWLEVEAASGVELLRLNAEAHAATPSAQAAYARATAARH